MKQNTYSFVLNLSKHKHLVEWIKKEKDENDVSLSALVRRLLEQEYKRRHG